MKGRAKRNANLTEADDNSLTETRKSSSQTSSGKIHNDQQRNKTRKKLFTERNSVFTDFMANENFRTIVHVLLSVCFFWLLSVMMRKYQQTNELAVPGGHLFLSGFRGFFYAVIIWLPMFLSTILFFGGYKTWTWLRAKQPSRLLDYIALTCLVSYLAVLFIWPLKLIFSLNMAPLMKGVISGERARLFMKVVAFVVTKAPECRRATDTPDKRKQTPDICPSFGTFLYFLFAPTLIYSDTYPRTKQIRWNFVAINFLLAFGCLYFGAAVLDNTINATAQNFGPKIPITYNNFVYAALFNSIAAFVLFWVLSIGLFHAFQNAFAEMLRFGDRLFYIDWWNQSSAPGYFRNAHILTQDWLNFYVYRPIKDSTNSRLWAQIGVFVLSGIEHEILCTAMTGFVYPVMFVVFVFISGPATFFIKDKSKTAWGNFTYLFPFPIVCGMMEVALAIEFFARFYCPQTLDSNWDFVVPRSWYCNRTTLETADTYRFFS